MPIRFTCPECARVYEVKDSLAGKRSRCGACDTLFEIPGGEPDRASSSGSPTESRSHRTPSNRGRTRDRERRPSTSTRPAPEREIRPLPPTRPAPEPDIRPLPPTRPAPGWEARPAETRTWKPKRRRSREDGPSYESLRWNGLGLMALGGSLFFLPMLEVFSWARSWPQLIGMLALMLGGTLFVGSFKSPLIRNIFFGGLVILFLVGWGYETFRVMRRHQQPEPMATPQIQIQPMIPQAGGIDPARADPGSFGRRIIVPPPRRPFRAPGRF